jgi:hypothetical protein
LFCTLSRGLVYISNANPACSCVYICKFQFRPIHPPSRRLSQIHVTDKQLVGLAFNELHTYLREKLDDTQFLSLAQLHQRALACESQSKGIQKPTRHNMHMVYCDNNSSNDKSKDMYANRAHLVGQSQTSSLFFFATSPKESTRRN